LGIAQLGTLTAGAPTDLLLFRKNPIEDLSVLDSLEGVVSQGRLYTTAMLTEEISQYRRQFTGRLYDTLTMAYVRRVLR